MMMWKARAHTIAFLCQTKRGMSGGDMLIFLILQHAQELCTSL